MRRFTPACVLAVLALFASVAWGVGKGKDGKDDVVGARWNYTLTKGSEEVKGHFRVYKKEVFHGGDKVGTVDVKDEDETTITFFVNWPEMHGKAILRKHHNRPPGANGKLHKKDGSEWEMKVHWKDG